VRVYRCCLPISLGLLLVVVGAAAVLVNLLIAALQPIASANYSGKVSRSRCLLKYASAR
jgi:hypothetical protein